MADNKRFKYLEHVGDVYVAAYGNTLEKAFESAALALMEVMTDTSKIILEVQEDVELESRDEYSLLYCWLEEFLILFEIENLLFSKFEVLKIEEVERGFKLKARIGGQVFDAEKHSQRVGVKAVTYHLMEVVKKPGEVTLKFLLDI